MDGENNGKPYEQMDDLVFEPKIGGGLKTPNHPFVHRVFHEINHPFWGGSPYFWKYPYERQEKLNM